MSTSAENGRSQRAANRLAGETSPYLLQHAQNPVDWFPWGEEALARARAQDRPMLLSIGYAACHWCHVMERESFENPAIAALMNEHFVPIKVDREERPDLDEIYMAATVALSGSGGWPMTVFLTPDQRPFFAGTYFPPDSRYGRPGFRDLLTRIAELWREDRAALLRQAGELTSLVRSQASASLPAGVGSDALGAAVRQLAKAFDPRYGGFSPAPKFPPASALSLLLRFHHRTGDEQALQMVRTTLDGMKNGGLYDQIGGGFARYSTDERWLVPHFEKMLYDNAQLSRVYLEAHQATGEPEYRRIAAETLDYVLREMQGEDGGYFSATDADSEGVEGKFFVWSWEEVQSLLGPRVAPAFSAYYDVSPGGNWEAKCILNTPRTLAAVARELGVAPAELAPVLEAGREALLRARARRVPPLLDDKVLVSWNALMIGAMAEGYRVLGDPRYLDSALRAVTFVTSRMMRPDGGLFRTARGGKAHLDAYLEDYAFLSDALVDLYEAAADAAHLGEALALAERMIRDFGAEDGGAFYQTARTHEELLTRFREGHDGALPSANAIAARVLARLSYHFGREDLRQRSVAAIRAYGREIGRAPQAFPTTLSVVDLLHAGPVEIVFACPAERSGHEDLQRALASVFLPSRVVAWALEADRPGLESDPEGWGLELPLLEGRHPVAGKATAYVCREQTCAPPATTPEALLTALKEDAERTLGMPPGEIAGRARAGHASPAATKTYAREHAQGCFRPLADTGLMVSALGFGGYRVSEGDSEHEAALVRALTSGVNLVDTSTNYTDGASERLIGKVLARLEHDAMLAREAVVVVSKIGYVQGSNLAHARALREAGSELPDMVELDDETWHCIHPEWIEDQLTRSLLRLGLQTLDICLLHNPEYFLRARHAGGRKGGSRAPVEAADREFLRRLELAFSHLEREIERGRIRHYGVSSNTLVASEDDVAKVSLPALLEAAARAGGPQHHFRIVQLPYNPLEQGAVRERRHDGRSVLDYAAEKGLAVLANRPLNAVAGDHLLRLVEPPELASAPELAPQLAIVGELEEQFRARFAPALRSSLGTSAVESLFTWSRDLRRVAEQLATLEQWRDIQAQVLVPQVERVVRRVQQALSGSLRAEWEQWRTEYLAELQALLDRLALLAAEKSREGLAAIRARLEAETPRAGADGRLSRLVLTNVASTPGVTSVLVGMRRPTYVDDAIAVLACLGCA